MIPITPEIMGPGIEEEYADALAAIADIRIALGPHKLTNHTPEGRVLMEIKWLEQEIDARRLPIPVDRSYVGTIFYLVGSNELAHYQGFTDAVGRLYLVLDGDGLIKTRHVPVLMAQIDDFLADAMTIRERLTSSDIDKLEALQIVASKLSSGQFPEWRPPQKQFSAFLTRPLFNDVPNGFSRLNTIDASLFEHRRPSPARKPPLPAPVPGLPEHAPPLPPEQESKLP